MNLVENVIRFDLVIVGYEFPASLDSNDANWLKVVIRATDKSGTSWKAEDSCLRTFELIKLRDWLYSVINDDTSESSISFTENELSFRYGPEGIIDVILDFNFHPKGHDYDYDRDSECVVRFTVNKRQLERMIDSMNAYIEMFPVKYITEDSGSE